MMQIVSVVIEYSDDKLDKTLDLDFSVDTATN